MDLQQQIKSVGAQLSPSGDNGTENLLPPVADNSSTPLVSSGTPAPLKHLILRVKRQKTNNKRCRSSSNVINKSTDGTQKGDDQEDNITDNSHLSCRNMIDVVVGGVKYRFVRRMTEESWKARDNKKRVVESMVSESDVRGPDRDRSDTSNGVITSVISAREDSRSLSPIKRKPTTSVQLTDRRQQSVKKINKVANVAGSNSANNTDNGVFLKSTLESRCQTDLRQSGVDEASGHGTYKRQIKPNAISAQHISNTNKRRELRLVAIDFYRSKNGNDQSSPVISSSNDVAPLTGGVDGGILLTATIVDEKPSACDKQSGNSGQAHDTVRNEAQTISNTSQIPDLKQRRRPPTTTIGAPQSLGKRSNRTPHHSHRDPSIVPKLSDCHHSNYHQDVTGKSLEDYYLMVLKADKEKRSRGGKLTDDDIDRLILSQYSGGPNQCRNEVVDICNGDGTMSGKIKTTDVSEPTSRLSIDETAPGRSEALQQDTHKIGHNNISSNISSNADMADSHDRDDIMDCGYEYYCLEADSGEGDRIDEDVDLFFCDDETKDDGEIDVSRFGGNDIDAGTMEYEEEEADEDLAYNFSSMSLKPNQKQKQEAWSQHPLNEEHWGQIHDAMEMERIGEGNEDETNYDEDVPNRNQHYYSIARAASSHLKALKSHCCLAREQQDLQKRQEAAFLRSVWLQEERERNRSGASWSAGSGLMIENDDIVRLGEDEKNELVFIPDESISGNSLGEMPEADLFNKRPSDPLPTSEVVSSRVISSDLSFQRSLRSGANGRTRNPDYIMANIGAEDPEVIFAEDDEYDSNNEDHYAYDYADESSSDNESEEWDATDSDNNEDYGADGWIEDDSIDFPTGRTPSTNDRNKERKIRNNLPNTHNFEFTDGADAFFSDRTVGGDVFGSDPYSSIPDDDEHQLAEREVMHAQPFHYIGDNSKRKEKGLSGTMEVNGVPKVSLQGGNLKANIKGNKRITFYSSDGGGEDSRTPPGTDVSMYTNIKKVSLAGLGGADDDDDSGVEYHFDDDDDSTYTSSTSGNEHYSVGVTDDFTFNSDDSETHMRCRRAPTAATLVIEGRDTFVNGEDD